MSALPGHIVGMGWQVFVCGWKTTLAGTSTPSALELHSRSNALPGADKTLVKYVVKTFIEFDANAWMFSASLRNATSARMRCLSANKMRGPPFATFLAYS